MFNEMMQSLSAYLAENPLTNLLNLSYYSFPVVEVIHVVTYGTFFGGMMMLDFRLARAVVLAFLFFGGMQIGRAAPEAFQVGESEAGELPEGKEADGIIGDFLLRNDLVEAVVSNDAPLRRANMSTFYGDDGITPGCLYDLTLRGVANDQLIIFSPSKQRGKVSHVRVVDDGSSGEAVGTRSSSLCRCAPDATHWEFECPRQQGRVTEACPPLGRT